TRVDNISATSPQEPMPCAAPTLDSSEQLGEVEVSVVMPCLNEARTVGRCVDRALSALGRLGVTGEVIVADNGSTDGSPALARSQGARVITVALRGYGSAVLGGVAAARGRFIIMGDADDSYDFAVLAPFLERLRDGDDLVLGHRFRGGIRPGAMPWLHRYVGNPLLTGLLNLLFRTPIRDAHCGLRSFRKDCYLRWGLTSSGMELASEMVVKACLDRARVSEFPIVLYPDGRGRRSHLRSFRDGRRHLPLLRAPRLGRRGGREMGQTPAPDLVFDDSHYARGPWRKLRRSLQLGPRYYLWDLPRYLARRRALRLPCWDPGAFFNPCRRVLPVKAGPFPPPPPSPEA